MLKPVMKNNTAKWKNELSNIQASKIECGIVHNMKELGYELVEESNWISKI